MSNFEDYAQFYDLFYEKKNYSEEVHYIESLITRHIDKANSILDLGCGTGIHASIFVEKGFEVHGVDKSSEMLKKAEERKLNLRHTAQDKLEYSKGDIRNIRLNRKFDVIISLFHVMSYQVTNDDVSAVLSTVKSHLEPGGLFIFDFWYGPGVLTDLPEKRIKDLNNNGLQLTRIAEPCMKPNENTVEIKYTVYTENDNKDVKQEVIESHNMRYYFKPELELFLNEARLEIVEFLGWMDKEEAGLNTWSAVVVSKLTN